MSRGLYLCGLQGLGWTLSLHEHEGFELGRSNFMPQGM